MSHLCHPYINLHFWVVVFLSQINDFLAGRSESVPEDFNVNMATPTSHHMVGSCFDATEAGTYFDGTGFLKAGE